MMCPVCKGVVQGDATDSISSTYPDVYLKGKKYKLVKNIIMFSAIVALLVVLLVDCLLNGIPTWSLACSVAILYAMFTVCFTGLYGIGIREKLAAQTLITMLAVYLLDVTLGYSGWSIDYGFPITIMVANAVILFFMIVLRNNWQDYLMLVLFTFALSLAGVALCVARVFEYATFYAIAFLSSLVIFLGSIVLGNDKATSELKRKFKI